MEAKVRKKSDGDGQDRVSHSKPKQYTRNLQRIFHNESNFKFRQLEDFDEDKELISPTESEQEDLLGLGNLEAGSYRPSKNGFTKQQNTGGTGPADRLVIINIVNGPGRYIDTIKHRQWPQPLNNQIGPEKS